METMKCGDYVFPARRTGGIQNPKAASLSNIRASPGIRWDTMRYSIFCAKWASTVDLRLPQDIQKLTPTTSITN